jgi:hypothetical protein
MCHEAAIAGRMENIQSVEACEPREFRLVPENVAYGGTKGFAYCDNFHRVAGELEERDILLQNEEREVVFPGIGKKSTREAEDVLTDSRTSALND